jgi:thymidylate synthase
MKQYQDLLRQIINTGEWKKPARENMPRTKTSFGTQMKFDLREGFPLVTTKKMYYKGIVTELLWFLKGDTNIKYLVDNGCNIWNQDAYRWYLKHCKDSDFEMGDIETGKDGVYPFTYEEFLEEIKNPSYTLSLLKNENYVFGDLGKVYGYQWRNQNGKNQLKHVVDGIKSNPESRYHIIDAWNLSDFSEMALPPCHLLYQFNCVERQFLTEEEIAENTPRYYLDLQMYQRSVDSFLGLPFNIASSALLLEIIAKTVNMIPRELTWVGGDTHIYENHFEQVNELLSREPLELCTCQIYKNLKSIKDIENLKPIDISFENYDSFSTIKAPLSTGL